MAALAAASLLASIGADARTHRHAPVRAHHRAAPHAAPLTADAVNDATRAPRVGPHSKGPSVLRAQILLDRARFSPGEIDGGYGSGLHGAIAGFQKARGLQVTGTVDAPTWKALDADTAPALIQYTVVADDVAGPFVPIPADVKDKALLPALGYTSPLEGLAEKFHSSPALLKQLNPRGDYSTAGSQLLVPDVTPTAEMGAAAKVVVDRSDLTVSVLDASGAVLAQYPATIGSEHDPLPLGDWKIKGVAHHPKFHYNPDLFWDAEPSDEKATLPPGPNNPVGVVWIDLSKDHYGIHGTPEPSTIGKTESHGCIRLTNWSATELAAAVKPGMPATLQE